MGHAKRLPVSKGDEFGCVLFVCGFCMCLFVFLVCVYVCLFVLGGMFACFRKKGYCHKYTRLETSGWNKWNKELWKYLCCVHLGRPFWNAYNFHRLLHESPILQIFGMLFVANGPITPFLHTVHDYSPGFLLNTSLIPCTTRFQVKVKLLWGKVPFCPPEGSTRAKNTVARAQGNEEPLLSASQPQLFKQDLIQI